MKVILASKNQHKLTELSAILSGLGFEIALESEYGLDIDVDETVRLKGGGLLYLYGESWSRCNGDGRIIALRACKRDSDSERAEIEVF